MKHHRRLRSDTMISMQQAMVKRAKRRMKRFIRQTPELVRYYEEYRQEVQEFQVPSYPDELVQRISECNVAYVGDFHTLHQSQKLVLRLLDLLAERRNLQEHPVILAMETFHAAHQAHLDDYLAGRLTFTKLLEHTRYRQNWGFPVEGYQEILETCRARAIPVIGINSRSRVIGERLRRRDRHAARTIVRQLKARPDALVLVFIGDLHVATPHLPLEVLRRTTRERIALRDLIVYTNPEGIYWQLADMGLEYMVNVVKLDRRRFAVMNATPLAKYDSFLRFMDGIVDDADDEPDDFNPLAPLNIEEQIVEFADRIAHFLELDPLELPEFEVTCWLSPQETVPELARRYGAPPEDVARIVACLRAREPCFVGRYGLLLHQFRLNDAADGAARLVLQACGWEKELTQSAESYFYDLIYEALVYFASKVINPKRTCLRESDLQERVETEFLERKPLGRVERHSSVVRRYVWPHLTQVWRLVEDGAGFQPDEQWWTCPLSQRIESTRLLGNRLGERLFYSAQVGLPAAHVRRGLTRRVTLGQVARLMLQPPSLRSTQELYLSLWANTADVREHHLKRVHWL